MSSFFTWDVSLDVGVEEMNHQHQILISLMDALYQRNTAGAPKSELVQSAQELVDYVIKHFKDEESYMQSIDFKYLEAHRRLHNTLLSDLAKFVENFKNSSMETIDKQFMMFLNLWISTHIRGIDTKYQILL